MESSESSEEVALLREECVLRTGFLAADSSSLLSLNRAARTAAEACERTALEAASGFDAVVGALSAFLACVTAPFDGAAATRERHRVLASSRLEGILSSAHH
jgi:uncharacterized membrane protein